MEVYRRIVMPTCENRKKVQSLGLTEEQFIEAAIKYENLTQDDAQEFADRIFRPTEEDLEREKWHREHCLKRYGVLDYQKILEDAKFLHNKRRSRSRKKDI